MPVEVTRFNPPEMGAPLGMYKQICRVRSAETIYIAGQLATNRDGAVVGAGDFDAQMRQVFDNIATALKSVGGSFANVSKFTTYLVDAKYISAFMRVRKELFPHLF